MISSPHMVEAGRWPARTRRRAHLGWRGAPSRYPERSTRVWKLYQRSSALGFGPNLPSLHCPLALIVLVHSILFPLFLDPELSSTLRNILFWPR